MKPVGGMTRVRSGDATQEYKQGEAVIDPQEILTKELQVLGVRLFSATIDEEEIAAARSYGTRRLDDVRSW